jgi:hypothetical protein
MHLHDDPVPPSKRTTREIPLGLEAIVISCLAKQAADRPQGAGTMSEMLVQCQDFGAWTRQLARKWWADNRSTLPMEEHEKTHSPLANTHRLVDTDGRTRP